MSKFHKYCGSKYIIYSLLKVTFHFCRRVNKKIRDKEFLMNNYDQG